MTPPPSTRPLARIALAAALLAAAYGTYAGRKRFIASFFPRGPGGASAPALAQPDRIGGRAYDGLAPAELVRVALLDGVDRATALELPAWSALCARGVDLRVDVGFPTVSLPVQSVLWTGRTQQQSGIEFVQARVTPPPEGALPPHVPDSAATAESHQFIAHSFGFAETTPPLETTGDALKTWEAGFPQAARALVASDRRLVFVHVLAADTAGHQHGRDSDEFRAAAAAGDALLGELVAADAQAHGARTRWFVLADHGHRAAGGHGGEEDGIRVVRACIAGQTDAWASAPSGHLVQLVNLSRALADSLGVAPPPDSAGRPLGAALAAPEQPRATLPRPGALRWGIAAALLAAAAIATWLAARRRAWRLPWWWVLAYLSVVTIQTVPSLSTPMIYKPLGRDLYMAALPGLFVLALTAGAAIRRTAPLRVVVAQLAVPAAMAAVGLALSWRTPPLMPLWTAHTSAFLVLLFSGLAVVALAVLAGLVPFGSGRGSPPETSDTSP